MLGISLLQIAHIPNSVRHVATHLSLIASPPPAATPIDAPPSDRSEQIVSESEEKQADSTLPEATVPVDETSTTRGVEAAPVVTELPTETTDHEEKPNGVPAGERDDDQFSPPQPFRLPPPQGYQYLGRSFGWWDAAALVTIQGLFYVVEYTQDAPDRAHFTAPLPAVDTPFRDLTLASTRKRRESADEASDYLWYASIAYPFASTAIVPWFRGSDWRPPVMMNLINLQAFVVSGLIVRMPHKWIGRTRPSVIGCEEEGEEYSAKCGAPSQLASFPSGHTQIAMTGAGLSCAHHIHGDLFGNALADAAGCGAALAAASAVGYLRMRGDRHWLSDTIVGAGIGFAIGYGIPTLFYYHPFWEGSEERAARKRKEESRETGFMVLPIATPSSGGLSVVGTFR